MSELSFTTLVDEAAREEARRWYAVNDGVMGGVSKSAFHVTQGLHAGQGEGRFVGDISLENGGGFASVRREPGAFERALTRAGGIALRVCGDGRTYQLRIKSRAIDEGCAYRVAFTPAKDEWQTWRFAWHEFEAVCRGRHLVGAPALAAGDIYQLGLLIADRRGGDFCLRLARIDAVP